VIATSLGIQGRNWGGGKFGEKPHKPEPVDQSFSDLHNNKVSGTLRPTCKCYSGQERCCSVCTIALMTMKCTITQHSASKALRILAAEN
jgi:hypothetical protein